MDIDSGLIRALQEDGRASIHALSERLGQTRATVSGRLRSLVDSETIRVIAAVDPAFLGQHVLAHVSVRTSGPAEPVADQLRARDETVLVSIVGGVSSVVAEVRVESMAALQETLQRMRGISGVLGINTLVYSAVLKGFFVSNYRGNVVVDDIDVALIEQLQRDGRKSYRSLGEIVRLSPSAVTTRVQRLVNSGVIKISVVEARGLSQRQLSMGVGLNLVDDRKGTLVDSLLAWRGVDFAALTIGRFDVLLTLVEPSAAELHRSLEQLKAHPDVVTVESWFHLAVVKEDYARTLRPPRLAADR